MNLKSLRDDFKTYSSKVNWFVFALVIVFNWGGWIEISSIWGEMPLMVSELPEGWRLPSLVTMVVQLGQIGSMAYLVIKIYFPNLMSFRTIIYVKLVLALICTLLISTFWKSTLFILGEDRSFGLLILTLVIAFCDGSTTLAILPYMTHSGLKKEYIIPYYIGETLYYVIPSVIAIVQGTGEDNNGCRNVTSFVNFTESVTLEPMPLTPRFSVSVFFLIIFMFLLMSTVAFLVLNCSTYVQIEKLARGSGNNDEEHDMAPEPLTGETHNRVDRVNLAEDPIKISMSAQFKKVARERQSKRERFEKTYLFVVNFLITFILYGVLPGLQSYSTLPYGNDVFHKSINLTSLFLPLVIFVTMASYNASLKQITLEFLVAVFFSVYILLLSLQSPCPILLNSSFGPGLAVLSWFMAPALFTRVRCLISSRLERYGEHTLLVSGAFTLLGEVAGGLIMFVFIDYLRLFNEKPECVFDKAAYCANYKF